MRKLSLLIGFAVLPLFYQPPLANSEPTSPAEVGDAAPKLIATETTFDFGQVAQGTKVNHDFVISNNGTAPLQIHSVLPSCGCTAAIVDVKEVAPGAQATLSTSFDTGGFQGEKVKTVRLNTNDPKQSSVVFTIQGTVTANVEVDPPRIYFGKIRQGEEKSVSATIKINEPGVKVQQVSSRSEVVSVKTSENPLVFSVRLSEKAKIGIFRSRIVVMSNSKSLPVLSVPVFANIVGDLTLVPADVSFGLLEAPLKSAVEQAVELRNDGPNKVNVTAVKSDSPDLIVEAVPSPAQSDKKTIQLIKIKLKEGFEGTLKAQIKITTDHPNPDEQTLTIPVYGIVAKKGA